MAFLSVDERVHHLVGLDYSKDLYFDDPTYDNSNQLSLTYDILLGHLGGGVSIKYCDYSPKDDRRLIFAQGMVNLDYLPVQISKFNVMLSLEYGFWEREIALTAYERDEVSDDLLHDATSKSIGNGYSAFGPRFRMWYEFQIFRWLALAPEVSFEFLKNYSLYRHNSFLARSEKNYEVYLSGGLCLKF